MRCRAVCSDSFPQSFYELNGNNVLLFVGNVKVGIFSTLSEVPRHRIS